MSTEWWTCEQGHDWKGDDRDEDEECPVCTKECEKAETAKEAMIDAKIEEQWIKQHSKPIGDE